MNVRCGVVLLVMTLNVLAQDTNKTILVQPFTFTRVKEVEESYTRQVSLEKPPKNYLPRQDRMTLITDVFADRKRAEDNFYWRLEPFEDKKLSTGWFIQMKYPTQSGNGRSDLASGWKLLRKF